MPYLERNRLAVVLWVAAVVGCSPQLPLSGVVVTGGDEQQRALAYEELARFDHWTSGLVTLRSVSFVENIETQDSEATVLGRYQTKQDRIEVDANLRGEEMLLTLRHELCHALDDDTKQIRSLEEELESVLAQASDPAHPYHWLAQRDDLKQKAKLMELFAYSCQQGPTTADLLSQECPRDQLPVGDLTASMMLVTWPGYEILPSGAHESSQVLVGDPFSEPFTTCGSASEALIRVELVDDSATFDINTGRIIDTDRFPCTASEREEPPLPFGVNLADATHPMMSRGGEAVAVVTPSLPKALSAGRVLHTRDNGATWKLFEACVDPGANVAIAWGEFYVVEPNDGSVRWLSPR